MPVRAAAAVTYDDPAGDALDTRPSMDILKVTHDFRQVNKSGPPSLVFEMTLGAPPEQQLVAYYARSTADGDCWLEAWFTPGRLLDVVTGGSNATIYQGCGDDGAFVPAKFLIKGNLLTWSIAVDSIPKPIREAGELQELHAYTQTTEPVFGIVGNGTLIPARTDSAVTDQTFRFA